MGSRMPATTPADPSASSGSLEGLEGMSWAARHGSSLYIFLLGDKQRCSSGTGWGWVGEGGNGDSSPRWDRHRVSDGDESIYLLTKGGTCAIPSLLLWHTLWESLPWTHRVPFHSTLELDVIGFPLPLSTNRPGFHPLWCLPGCRLHHSLTPTQASKQGFPQTSVLWISHVQKPWVTPPFTMTPLYFPVRNHNQSSRVDVSVQIRGGLLDFQDGEESSPSTDMPWTLQREAELLNRCKELASNGKAEFIKSDVRFFAKGSAAGKQRTFSKLSLVPSNLRKQLWEETAREIKE